MTSNKIPINFGTFCSNESNWAFSGYFCKECKKRSNTDVSCSYKNRSYFASSAAALGLTLGLGESKASEARRNKSVSCSQRCCLEKQIFLLQPFWRTIFNLPKFFEFDVQEIVETNSETNTTYAKINLNPTNLRLDDNYVYYYVNWSRFLVSGLIPLVSLTVLNFAIYR